MTISDDSVTISLSNFPIVDQFTFPNAGGVNLGNSGVATTLTFNATYNKTRGTARHVRPTSTDPLSPFNWAGEMSDATNSGSFSVTHTDGSFSAQGTFSSQGNFGEVGRERNGSFVQQQDQGQGPQAAAALQQPGQTSAGVAGDQPSANATPASNSPKFRGKVPMEAFVH